jgi:integrase
MTTLAALIDAFIVSDRTTPLGQSALSRLAYWRDALGARPVAEITADEVDAALAKLIVRGRLRPLRGKDTERTHTPLKGSTINRYVSDLGTLHKFARRLRIVPRAHLSPTAGIERAPEPVDPERYLRAEEVERLIAMARVVDRHWNRLPALIRLAFVTGIRRGNLLALRWRDVDLEARTVTVERTKNGRPMIAPIPDAAVVELKRLPQPSPDALVFEGRRGKPHGFRKLWLKTCREAGLAGHNFHQLRHGTATALARAGVNQASLMAALGHRTLAASARYMHHNVDDRRAVMERVFGP